MIDFEPEGRLYIGGEFREAAAGGRFEVRSPSDESVVGTAADAQAEDVAAAVGAARRAADETSWGTDHAFRQRVLRQLQDALRKSTTTCLYVLTTAVPFTVDGATSTGKFAAATGTGTAVVVSSGDDPKLSDGTCNTSRTAPPSATTAVATFTATIKLTVRQ